MAILLWLLLIGSFLIRGTIFNNLDLLYLLVFVSMTLTDDLLILVLGDKACIRISLMLSSVLLVAIDLVSVSMLRHLVSPTSLILLTILIGIR